MADTRVIVAGRGKAVLLDRLTEYFDISQGETGEWVLSLDSEACAEKRSKTRKFQLDEYILGKIVSISMVSKTKNVVNIITTSIKEKREC